MKKSQIFKMLALVTATMAFAACGSSTPSSTTTTDTTSDVPLSGDSTATTDTMVDTATGDVAAVTVDPAAVPAPWSSTGCPYTYTVPATAPGCTGADDQAWVTMSDATTSVNDNFGNIVSDCTLKNGCLAMGSTCASAEDTNTAMAICITDCVVKTCTTLADTDPASAKCSKMTKGCAYCYGRFDGTCGYAKCLAECAVDSSSTACRDCLATNCDTVRDLCKNGK